MKPERTPYLHEISTQEDLDFLVNWLRVAMEIYPEMRGRINTLSIPFTSKFIGVDNTGTVQVCRKEI